MFYIWILFKWDELVIHFFFFLFFGGPWSELLEESESESEADEDDDEDELELSSLSLLLSSDEELDESLLSDEESLEELEESLLLLSELEDLIENKTEVWWKSLVPHTVEKSNKKKNHNFN